MRNKKILITGGAGFIGSNLALTLQERYPENEYFIIDDFSTGSFNNLLNFKGDIIAADLSQISLENYFKKLDIIFHQASITDTTVMDEREMIFKNVESFRKVLEFGIKIQAKIIYASSAAIYGKSNHPMRVGFNENPTNVYGFSKLVMDNITRKYFKTYKDNMIIGLRYFNVYGPKENYKGKMASMIWQLFLQMREGKQPRIFKFGEQKRDQVYVKDVVEANILALKAKKSTIVNVGTGKTSSFNEMIENLNKVLKTKLKPFYFDNPYEYYQDYTEADLVETEKILGYKPKYNIVEGIKDYFRDER